MPRGTLSLSSLHYFKARPLHTQKGYFDLRLYLYVISLILPSNLNSPITHLQKVNQTFHK